MGGSRCRGRGSSFFYLAEGAGRGAGRGRYYCKGEHAAAAAAAAPSVVVAAAVVVNDVEDAGGDCDVCFADGDEDGIL